MPQDWTRKEQTRALVALAARREKAKKEGQIDNATLYAGSAMHYYCNHCGLESDVLPESHSERPKHVCDACQTLIDHGYDFSKKEFVKGAA